MYLTLDQVLLQHISFNNRVKSSGKKTAVMHDHYTHWQTNLRTLVAKAFLFFFSCTDDSVFGPALNWTHNTW